MISGPKPGGEMAEHCGQNVAGRAMVDFDKCMVVPSIRMLSS